MLAITCPQLQCESVKASHEVGCWLSDSSWYNLVFHIMFRTGLCEIVLHHVGIRQRGRETEVGGLVTGAMGFDLPSSILNSWALEAEQRRDI